MSNFFGSDWQIRSAQASTPSTSESLTNPRLCQTSFRSDGERASALAMKQRKIVSGPSVTLPVTLSAFDRQSFAAGQVCPAGSVKVLSVRPIFRIIFFNLAFGSPNFSRFSIGCFYTIQGFYLLVNANLSKCWGMMCVMCSNPFAWLARLCSWRKFPQAQKSRFRLDTSTSSWPHQ